MIFTKGTTERSEKKRKNYVWVNLLIGSKSSEEEKKEGKETKAPLKSLI